MAVPSVQIMVNAEKMRIFFDFDPSTYVSYDLYYSSSATMAGAVLIQRIPNIPDGTYSKSHVLHDFRRSSIGYNESDTFYLQLEGVTAGGPSGSYSAIKYVPAVEDKIPSYNPVQLQGYDGNVWRRAASDTSGRLDTV